MSEPRLLWAGPTRVYFNAKEEAPLVWSVDDGDPNHEVKCPSVVIESSAAQSVFMQQETGQPRAWFVAVGVAWRNADGSVVIRDDRI